MLCFSLLSPSPFFFFFFFNDTATTEIYTLSLHDALPICPAVGWRLLRIPSAVPQRLGCVGRGRVRQVPDQRSWCWAVWRIQLRRTDPHMHAVDAPIGHLDNFSTNYAVMLRRDAAQPDSGT